MTNTYNVGIEPPHTIHGHTPEPPYRGGQVVEDYGLIGIREEVASIRTDFERLCNAYKNRGEENGEQRLRAVCMEIRANKV